MALIIPARWRTKDLAALIHEHVLSSTNPHTGYQRDVAREAPRLVQNATCPEPRERKDLMFPSTSLLEAAQ
jgi:hypothetical protein